MNQDAVSLPTAEDFERVDALFREAYSGLDQIYFSLEHAVQEYNEGRGDDWLKKMVTAAYVGQLWSFLSHVGVILEEEVPERLNSIHGCLVNLDSFRVDVTPTVTSPNVDSDKAS